MLESRRTVGGLSTLSRSCLVVMANQRLTCFTANQEREFLSQILLDNLPVGLTDSSNDWSEAEETGVSKSRFGTGSKFRSRSSSQSSRRDQSEAVNSAAFSSLDLILIQSNQRVEEDGCHTLTKARDRQYCSREVVRGGAWYI